MADSTRAMTDPTVILTVRLPLALDMKLRAVASAEDRTIAYLVRLAIERFLDPAEIARRK